MQFKIGDRVVHFGHGPGTVVGINTVPKNAYFQEKPLEAIRLAGSAGLIGGLANSLYDGERYPYIVKFDYGYQDVYSENDLTGAVDNGDGTGSLKGKLVGMGF